MPIQIFDVKNSRYITQGFTTNEMDLGQSIFAFSNPAGAAGEIAIIDPAKNDVLSFTFDPGSKTADLNSGGSSKTTLLADTLGGKQFTIANGGGVSVGNWDVLGNISKFGGSFKIDHPNDPKNKILYHSFVESPDMMNIYNGNATTDANGDAQITLPSYFDALNMEFRYQLTCIGSFAQAIVFKEIKGNSFSIKTDKPNIKVSWQVTGIRKDDYANDHRIKVEVEKKGAERGKLLYQPNSQVEK